MMSEMKRELEKELGQRGWAMRFDYKNPILDNIGFTAQMYSDPQERIDFIKVAREVLEEKGLLSRKKREIRERRREENRTNSSILEKKFQEEGWPLKVESKNAMDEIFFESQCKALYDEERREFIKIARKAIGKDKR